MLQHAAVGLAALASLMLSLPDAAWARGRMVIDDNDRVTLPRSVHPLARARHDRGASPSGLPMQRMILSLRLPADRQARLDRLLQEQQDPRSDQYHRWLSPEEFGAQFGPAPEDVAAVTQWLASHGFTIQERSRAGTWVNFSGTAAQVQRAFRTEIHDYQVNGRVHHANASAPEIPRALAGVVSGVVTMHNFPRKSMLKSAATGTVTAAAPVTDPPTGTATAKATGAGTITATAPATGTVAGSVLPAYTSGSGNHTLAPGDFAAIYNLNPLYQGGIDGSGQAIAIVGRTHPSSTNWSSFRSSFGLPAGAPQVILNGSDPGDQGADENGEADLDVEWSGAVAKNADILFVASRSTYATDGVDLSAQYIVDHNLAPVMSTSFGSCEADMGATENQFYNNLWQQAAAQGITSLVSTGDSGAAGCDDPNAASGSGAAVNGLASTPYNVAVGGSQFSEGSGSYWSAGNATDGSSALGYIPEKAWNESGSQAGGYGLWSTGGGASSRYGKPSWQSAQGVPADGRRDIPDVSLSAASHDGYRVRTQGSWYIFGGTSASSPSFAGLMALVVQSTGQRQGNANPRLYQLAAAQYGSAGARVFHDINAGSNGVPGVAGHASGTAYDLATGLGSVDAAALVANWGGDALLPAVGATLPVDGAAGVAVAGAVRATFSRPMAPGSITAASFTLTDPADNPVPGSVSYDLASYTASFSPSAPLAYGTPYRASLGTGVQDVAGNHLAAAATWNFTTLQQLSTLAVAVTGSGTVNSTPGGIACGAANSGSCTGQYDYGTAVTLVPTSSNGYQFGGWNGGCASLSGKNCLVSLAGDRAVAANFTPVPPVRLAGGGAYASLQEAYHAGSASCTLQALDADLSSDWTLDEGKTVLVEGGFTSDFSASPGTTTITGLLAVRTGTLRAKGLAVK